MIPQIGIGDVIAVDSGTLIADIVELGEDLAGKPGVVGHVIGAHHQDKRGTWWGLEGRPGGVGWRTLDHYLTAGPRAVHDNSNWWQPRDDPTRAMIANLGVSMLGVGYDSIGGIVADVLGVIKARELAELVDHWWGWQDPANPHVRPGHVVCSSYWAWIYNYFGLPHPEVAAELTMPADWWLYNEQGKDSPRP